MMHKNGSAEHKYSPALRSAYKSSGRGMHIDAFANTIGKSLFHKD